MKNLFKEFYKGLLEQNPVLVLLLGMCPTLAVTTAASNGLAMGLCTMFVLICSNVIISALRKIIPANVRIPAYIVIIASFVTIVDLVMGAKFHQMHKTLGLFIPLIVVNCIILGRAEAYASQKNILFSFFDGLGMGLGFTLALTVLGAIRELLGAGSIFNHMILPVSYKPVLLMVLPPGAFITLGFILVILKKIKE